MLLPVPLHQRPCADTPAPQDLRDSDHEEPSRGATTAPGLAYVAEAVGGTSHQVGAQPSTDTSHRVCPRIGHHHTDEQRAPIPRGTCHRSARLGTTGHQARQRQIVRLPEPGEAASAHQNGTVANAGFPELTPETLRPTPCSAALHTPRGSHTPHPHPGPVPADRNVSSFPAPEAAPARKSWSPTRHRPEPTLALPGRSCGCPMWAKAVRALMGVDLSQPDPEPRQDDVSLTRGRRPPLRCMARGSSRILPCGGIMWVCVHV